MNLTNYFDISRFWLLLKMELFRSRKGVGMTLEIAFGLHFFVGLLLETIMEENKIIHEYNTGYAFTLILGGFVLSSLAFSDLSNSLKRYSYLTLPVSTLEKFLCMWLLTTVGWVVLYTILFTIYTLIASAIGHVLFSYMTFQPFEPLNVFATDTMRYYFVLQGIFLAGAVHFKGYAFPKTLFLLVLFAIVCGIIAYFFMADLFQSDTGTECTMESNFLIGTPVHQFWIVIKWLFWWVLAPLCWIVTYLGLRDREA
jgi:hypothetical protein